MNYVTDELKTGLKNRKKERKERGRMNHVTDELKTGLRNEKRERKERGEGRKSTNPANDSAIDVW